MIASRDKEVPSGNPRRFELCFGAFSTYGEPNRPLSWIQLSGAIEETGLFFALYYFLLRLCDVFALLHVRCDGWFKRRSPFAAKIFIANTMSIPKLVCANTMFVILGKVTKKPYHMVSHLETCRRKAAGESAVPIQTALGCNDAQQGVHNRISPCLDLNSYLGGL